MNRREYLDTAMRIVCDDRPNIHGDVNDCFNLIAAHWSTFLGHRFKQDLKLSGADVAVLMTLFKLSRLQINSKHADNVVDGIGYLALAGELQDYAQWTMPQE